MEQEKILLGGDWNAHSVRWDPQCPPKQNATFLENLIDEYKLIDITHGEETFAFVSLCYGRSGEEICTGYAMAASGRMQYDYKQTNMGKKPIQIQIREIAKLWDRSLLSILLKPQWLIE